MNHATGDFFFSSHHAILYHIPAQKRPFPLTAVTSLANITLL